MKNTNVNQIERAFRLGQPIDDAVKRAARLAKKNRLPAGTKMKLAASSRTAQKSK